MGLCMPLPGGAACSKAVIVTFDGQNAFYTFPSSINLGGSIVGTYADSTTGHGFLRAPDGMITTIDPPGSVDTTAVTINDSGSIAQVAEDQSAEISRPVPPSSESDGLAGMPASQRACEVRSEGGFERRIGCQSALGRRRDGNGLNLVMAYSWWKDRK